MAPREAIEGLAALAAGEGLLLTRQALLHPLASALDVGTLLLGWVLILGGALWVLYSVVAPVLPARFRKLQRISEAEVKQRSRDLSLRILRFLNARERGDQWKSPWWVGWTKRTSEARKQKDFHEQVKNSSAYSQETMGYYDEEFLGETLGLFDEAQKRGWVKQEDRFWFEHATNTLAIRQVAARLGAIGHRVS